MYGPLKVLQQFKLQPCTHKSTLSASKCIQRMIGNKNKEKLFIATQVNMIISIHFATNKLVQNDFFHTGKFICNYR